MIESPVTFPPGCAQSPTAPNPREPSPCRMRRFDTSRAHRRARDSATRSTSLPDPSIHEISSNRCRESVAEPQSIASGCTGLSATQADFASGRSLDTRTHHTRLALPWNTLLAGLVWIIHTVSPWGGST